MACEGAVAGANARATRAEKALEEQRLLATEQAHRIAEMEDELRSLRLAMEMSHTS